jgi:hypothetical protein
MNSISDKSYVRCCRFLEASNYCSQCKNDKLCSTNLKCSNCCGRPVHIDPEANISYGKTEWSSDGKYRYIYKYNFRPKSIK